MQEPDWISDITTSVISKASSKNPAIPQRGLNIFCDVYGMGNGQILGCPPIQSAQHNFLFICCGPAVITDVFHGAPSNTCTISCIQADRIDSTFALGMDCLSTTQRTTTLSLGF